MSKLIFSSSQSIALDTNIFIYAYNRSSPYFEVANKLLEDIKKIAPKTFISVLVIEEFLVKIFKLKLEKDLSAYLEFLTGSGLINVRQIDTQIAITAAKLRAQYPSLRTPDAIHLATALESDVTIFITVDKRLPAKISKLNIKILKVVL